MPEYAKKRGLHVTSSYPLAGRLRGVWVKFPKDALKNVFLNTENKPWGVEPSAEDFYRRKLRGGDFKPPVIALLLRENRWVYGRCFTPARMEFFLQEESKTIMTQALLITGKTKDSEISPSLDIVRELRDKGVVDPTTKECVPVTWARIVGVIM